MQLVVLHLQDKEIVCTRCSCKVTLVGLYQCNLEYSSNPRADGLCKLPSPNLELGITVSTQPKWWVSTFRRFRFRSDFEVRNLPQ